MSKRGLSLAEVILALGLISIAGLALIATFLSGTRMMDQSTDLSMATDVGREFLETVRAQGYEQTVVGVFDGSLPTPPDATTAFPSAPYPTTVRDQEEFTVTVDCSQYSPSTRLLKVTVSWEGKHRTTLAAMIHR